MTDADGCELISRAPSAAEAKPEGVESIAVDANALAGAIGAGRGVDLGRLIEHLLRERPAA
ncbi:MAG: hypothetical protein AAGA55_11880 [Planctomycetota bacterium]